jgi:hypothetical protein
MEASTNWTWVVYTLNTIKDEYSNKPMTNSDISLVINNRFKTYGIWRDLYWPN